MPHSPMHAPCGLLSYVFWFSSVIFILSPGSSFPEREREKDRGREREGERVDIMTVSVKITIFDVVPIFFGTTDLYEILKTYLPCQELFL